MTSRTAKPGRPAALVVLPLIVLALVFGTLPMWTDDYWIRVWTGVAMWAGLAASWNIIGGYAGYISFGHVAFFGIGAYATAILMQPGYDWNFFLTLPVGAVIAGLFALIVGWPTLRLRGAYFAIATWALAEALAQIINTLDFTGGSFGLSTPGNPSTWFFYYAMLIATILIYLLTFLLFERSRFGYKVKAVRDNEAAAQSLGINTTAVKLQAFMLSAALPAVLGGINAYWITFINPQSVLSGEVTDQMVVMTLIGGLGHLWGPALGAFVLYLASTWLGAEYGGSTSYIAMIGALLAIIILFLPDGLIGLAPRARGMKLVRKMLGLSGAPGGGGAGTAPPGGRP
ncbi:MAG: branched-chain amino acid ABC transporter permease [Hyphomicrobiales bacterium]|nr:branched-chain amino acid ABC transporter permease [Hyphomicrobiales bacterium]